jgi:hypothetical protein
MSFEKPLKLVKTTVASGIIDRSPSTMAKDRMRGTGCPYVKYPGGAVRYDIRVLEEYAAEHTRRSTSETTPREFEAPITAEPPAKPKLQKRARPAEPAPAEWEAT